MLIWTAIAAGLCVLLRQRDAFAWFDLESLLVYTHATPSVVLVALLILRGAYTNWRRWLRAMTVGLASLAFCALCFWLDNELGLVVLLSIGLAGAWVATIVSAILLLLAGYRVAERTPI